MNNNYSLYNNLPVGIFVINKEYEILFWNNMMENFTKIESEKVLGENLLKLFPHLNKKMYRFRIEQIFAGGTPAIFSSQLHKYIIPCKLPNGEFRTQQTTVSRVLASNENDYNAVFSIQDISDETKRIEQYRIMRKQSLEEIEKRKIIEAELRESNATKDKFVSIISHDLKNPFVTLLGFSEMIIMDFDEFSESEIKTYLNEMYKVSKSTYTLLEDLLMWSRSQKDMLKLNKVDFYISQCADQTISTLSNIAKRKLIKLKNNIDENQIVNADEDTIRTVIRNLISNAIKFTNTQGEIKLSSKQNDEEIIFSISDNGVGIDPGRLNEIFNVGTHTSTEGTNHEKGTGLGLVLCREFVEKNGGKIWVESELGKGSIFKFSLPIK